MIWSSNKSEGHSCFPSSLISFKVFTYFFSLCACVRVYEYACVMCVYECLCMCTYVLECVYVCLCMCMYVLWVCMSVCACVRMCYECVYICLYMCMYVCFHGNIHDGSYKITFWRWRLSYPLLFLGGLWASATIFFNRTQDSRWVPPHHFYNREFLESNLGQQAYLFTEPSLAVSFP